MPVLPSVDTPGWESCDALQWIDTIAFLQADELRPSSPLTVVALPHDSPHHEPQEISRQGSWLIIEESDSPSVRSSESDDDDDDDLDVALAKAALQTGATAFEAKEWNDADALLQETVKVLQQLLSRQRGFCDLLLLHHQLAVCSFHLRAPRDAESALLSFIRMHPATSEHRRCLHDAAHHLALLYLRTHRVEEARAQCEKALQGRRRLLGKHSEAALQSTALMAHIYTLADNPARAKACLAMIPEARRSAVVDAMEVSVGGNLVPSESLSLPNRPGAEMPDRPLSEVPVEPRQSICNDMCRVNPAVQRDSRCHGSVSPPRRLVPKVSFVRPIYRDRPSMSSGFDMPISPTAADTPTPCLPRDRGSISTVATGDLTNGSRSPDLIPNSTTPAGTCATKVSPSRSLSRADILRDLHYSPSNRVEAAVCNSDLSALTSLLQRRKSGLWFSKLHSTFRAKPVTALHFAALFGEVEMARLLLDAGYDMTTGLGGSSGRGAAPEARPTPLKFAIGARQAEMVSFLLRRGARPVEPDTWSTLAGLLLDPAWLLRTCSRENRCEGSPDEDEGDDDDDDVTRNIVAILRLWLKHGWDPNVPYTPSGRTLLHQVVAFESRFPSAWDAGLRGVLARFLCNEGADPTCRDVDGVSPYHMANVLQDGDLLVVFELQLGVRDAAGWRGRGESVEVALGIPKVAELEAKETLGPSELEAEVGERLWRDEEVRAREGMGAGR